jgi:hypothetical protein
MISCAVNELMKKRLADSKGKSVSELELKDRLIAGACAGLCYWMGTFPLDVVKVNGIIHDSQNYS